MAKMGSDWLYIGLGVGAIYLVSKVGKPVEQAGITISNALAPAGAAGLAGADFIKYEEERLKQMQDYILAQGKSGFEMYKNYWENTFQNYQNVGNIFQGLLDKAKDILDNKEEETPKKIVDLNNPVIKNLPNQQRQTVETTVSSTVAMLDKKNILPIPETIVKQKSNNYGVQYVDVSKIPVSNSTTKSIIGSKPSGTQVSIKKGETYITGVSGGTNIYRTATKDFIFKY